MRCSDAGRLWRPPGRKAPIEWSSGCDRLQRREMTAFQMSPEEAEGQLDDILRQGQLNLWLRAPVGWLHLGTASVWARHSLGTHPGSEIKLARNIQCCRLNFSGYRPTARDQNPPELLQTESTPHCISITGLLVLKSLPSYPTGGLLGLYDMGLGSVCFLCLPVTMET